MGVPPLITPPNPIIANTDFRYDGLFQSMALVLLQRQIDAVNAISGGGDTFKNKILKVETLGTTFYIGYAEPGSLTNVTVWAIKKVVEIANEVTITWSDGTKEFDNKWDDRLILTYS
tara:strand:+ start:278 stop:628 length:351 start_codon:yes stop_codon:yes gene_type:complete